MAKARASKKGPAPSLGGKGMKRTFREACIDRGYDPADVLVMWRQLAGQKAMEYLEYAQKECKHPDFPGAGPRILMEKALRELAALAKWDLELLPYAYGRPHQTTEVTATVFNPKIPEKDVGL